MVNAYSMAFFDEHLKGQTSPLLEGVAVYEVAEFQKKIPDSKE